MADYKAKRHNVLDNLKKELLRGFVSKTFDVDGHKYELSTLNEDEETWADSLVRPVNMMSTVTSRKAPRLAAALRSIDGVTVEQLFQYPDDMPRDIKNALDDNPIQRKFWVRDQVLYFLAEDAPRQYVTTLFEKLNELEKERDEVLKNVPK